MNEAPPFCHSALPIVSASLTPIFQLPFRVRHAYKYQAPAGKAQGKCCICHRPGGGGRHSSPGMKRPRKSPDPTTRPERSNVLPSAPSSGLKVASSAPERERSSFLYSLTSFVCASVLPARSFIRCCIRQLSFLVSARLTIRWICVGCHLAPVRGFTASAFSCSAIATSDFPSFRSESIRSTLFCSSGESP